MGGFRVDRDSARLWVVASLNRGHAVSRLLPQRVAARPGDATLLAERDPQPGAVRTYRYRHGLNFSARDAAVAAFITDRTTSGEWTLVIEEDILQPDDCDLGEAVMYWRDRVLRWVDLSSTRCTDPAAELRRGASGYPLNAFLCSGSPTQLRLRNNAEASDELCDELAAGTAAVIVSAYDDHAYLAWEFGRPLALGR